MCTAERGIWNAAPPKVFTKYSKLVSLLAGLRKPSMVSHLEQPLKYQVPFSSYILQRINIFVGYDIEINDWQQQTPLKIKLGHETWMNYMLLANISTEKQLYQANN